MLRINAVNFKQNQHNKPSPLYSLFSNNNHRDILTLVAAYASADDISQAKMSSKAAYFNINKWLDQTFSNPVLLLKALGKLNKIQISSLLQKYFADGSPYLEIMRQSDRFEDPRAAYACCALVAYPNDLKLEDLDETLTWMRANQIAPHLISSIKFIRDLLDPPEDEEDEEEVMDVCDIIRLHPDAYLNLRGEDLIGANLYNLDLRGANLQHTLLKRAQLGRSNLTGAWLQHAAMERCYAANANFTDANLQFANLDKAYLYEANFDHADLRFTSLRDANLSYATLNRAALQGANFKRATLQEADAVDADFSRANLSCANLQSANLSAASLDHTKLAGTLFFNTDLSHANLQHAVQQPSFMPLARFTPNDEGERLPKMRKL